MAAYVKPLIADDELEFVADIPEPVRVRAPLYPVLNSGGLEVAYAHTAADAQRVAAALGNS